MSDLNNATASFDFSSLNFDLSDLSDQPAAVREKFEVAKREAQGPSEDQQFVAALLNSVPGKKALTAVKVMVLVRRFRNIPAEEELKETTVRGWLNRACDLGLIAKATGKLGFCALDSEDRASDEELAKRKEQIAAARAAKAEGAKEEMKAEQAAAYSEPVSSADNDVMQALGL